jgi:hypothetical protein
MYAQWSLPKDSPESLVAQNIGIVVGVIAFLVMVAFAVYYYCKWKQPTRVYNEKQITEMKDGEEVNVRRKSRARKKKMWKPREPKKIDDDLV